MRALAILVCLILAGCAQRDTGPSVADIQADCKVGGRPFVETWSCERVGISGMYGYADIKAVYIATGDYVAEQVKDGNMTDAEAKLAMARARQQAGSDSAARHQRETANSSAADAVVLSRMMNRPAGLPAPQPPPMPRSNIVCWRTGASTVMCN